MDVLNSQACRVSQRISLLYCPLLPSKRDHHGNIGHCGLPIGASIRQDNIIDKNARVSIHPINDVLEDLGALFIGPVMDDTPKIVKLGT